MTWTHKIGLMAFLKLGDTVATWFSRDAVGKMRWEILPPLVGLLTTEKPYRGKKEKEETGEDGRSSV